MRDFLSHVPAWHLQAACRGVKNPDIFFPHGNTATEAAIELCGRCPVRDACRQSATDLNLWGTWGGTTRPERRAARQNREYRPPQGGPFGQAVLNAQKTHCKWGHQFTPENTRWCQGKRSCIACEKRRRAERRAATAARKQGVPHGA